MVAKKLSPLDLDRNDVDGALELAERSMRSGTWDFSRAEFLLMLQDDPTKLDDELRKLERRIKTKR